MEEETEQGSEEVEKIKKEEAEQAAKDKAIDALKDKMKDIVSDAEWTKEIALCEENMGILLSKITPVKEVQNKLRKKLESLSSLPAKLLAKLKKLTARQEKLKSGKKGIPLIGKVLSKVKDLITKSKAATEVVEIITGKEIKLQDKIEGFGQRIEKIENTYTSKVKKMEQLKTELSDLVAEKLGLEKVLDKPIGEVKQVEEKVNDFLKRYTLFGTKKECESTEEVEKEIEELEEEQVQTEPELEEVEKELEEANEEEERLQTRTKVVEQEIDEYTEEELERKEKKEELKQEEEAIQREFGQKIELKPVPAKEWAESFEVKRPYWDAVFHPDEEVVAGYKGRYFEILLKDAQKKIKLLFEAGEYYMDKGKFRDQYGSIIGAFVTEALHFMKQVDQSKVHLFVQGSADIVGKNTFKGDLDRRFFYEQISVLPRNFYGDGYAGTPTVKNIPPQNFRNTHLPDLRGNFLKEMISVYSKKLKPIQLEGQCNGCQGRRRQKCSDLSLYSRGIGGGVWGVVVRCVIKKLQVN